MSDNRYKLLKETRKSFKGNKLTRIKLFFRKYLPKFYYLLFKAKCNEHRNVRRLLSLPFGLFIGFLFFAITNEIFHIEKQIKQIVFNFVVISSCIFYTLSIQMRVISWLILPTFLGKLFRSYLLAAVFAILISGPLTNIMLNIFETSKVLTCLFSLHLNQTNTRLQLLFKPLTEVFRSLNENSEKIGQRIVELEEKFLPFEINLLNITFPENNNKNIKKLNSKMKIKMFREHINNLLQQDLTEQQLKNNLNYKCESVFTKGEKECKKSFIRLEEECKEAFGKIFGHLLCLHYKVDIICSVINGFTSDRMCKEISTYNVKNLDNDFNYLENFFNNFQSNFDVKANLKFSIDKEKFQSLTPEIISKILSKQLLFNLKYFSLIKNIINEIIVILFLFSLLKSNTYHNLYLRDIYFDNIYIRDYIYYLDAKRFKRGSEIRDEHKSNDSKDDKQIITLFPLKTIEKQELITLFSKRLTMNERNKTFSLWFIGFIFFLSSLLLLFIDYFLSLILILIKDKSLIKYNETGEHIFIIKVFGNGLMASLVKTIIKNFSINEKVNNIDVTNEQCLPDVKFTSFDDYLSLLVLIILFLVFNQIEIYFLRLRSVIAGFFYPRRERKRLIYLYNERIRKRKNFLKYSINKVRKLAKEKLLFKETNLNIYLLKYFKYLRLIKLFQERCLICNDYETFYAYNKKLFHHCVTPGCNLIYCKQCWNLIKKHCYGCSPVDSDDTDLSDNDQV